MTNESKRSTRKGRPNYPIEFKRLLAQQASEPGISVSQLAREQGVNANMLFKWRRHYRAGQFEEASAVPVLLPVSVTAPTDLPTAASSSAPSETALGSSGIEIAFVDCTLRIDRQADMTMVRAVLALLRA